MGRRITPRRAAPIHIRVNEPGGWYQAMAEREDNVIFGGRLGSYKYLDMHQAIGSALRCWSRRIEPHFAEGRSLALKVA